MRVLGIDPGTTATGWGVVEVAILPGRGPSHRHIASGVIRVKGELPMRLAGVFAGVCDILAEHAPQALSIEKTFVSENIQSAFRLGEARGTVLVAAARAGVAVYEYSPAEIKMAVVGYGRAVKDQVQSMVTRLLSLPNHPATDEADALAAALCHLHADRIRSLAGDLALQRRGKARRPSAPPVVHLRLPRSSR